MKTSKLADIKVKVAFAKQYWWSGHSHQDKGEGDLNQSNADSFVKREALNNNRNNGDCEIFLINCFVLVITLV